MGDKEIFPLERRSQIEVAAKSFMKHIRAGEPSRTSSTRFFAGY